MRNPAVHEPANDAMHPLDAALRRWASDSHLASITTNAAFLVLDGEGERIVHASEPADTFAHAISDNHGRILSRLELSGQIRRLGALDAQPRLVRLRLDPRGVASPLPCRVARTSIIEGTDVVVLAPLVIPAGLRAVRVRPPPSQVAPHVAAPASAPHTEPVTAPSGRFTWRSGGDGIITHVAGAGEALTSFLVGKSWRDLSGAGHRALVAALSEKRTFRALTLSVPATDRTTDTELQVSGAPTGRPNGSAAGYAGFAILREQDVAPLSEPDAPAAPNDDSAEPPATVALEETVQPVVQGELEPIAGLVGQRVAAAALVDRAAEGNGALPPDLSNDEHAAFREIARALGARFAGDEARPAAPEEPRKLAAPLSPAAESAAPPSTTIKAAFESLPAAVLIHREGEPLFCNRRFLDLVGVPDIDAVTQLRGVEALLRSSEAAPAEETLSLAHPDGESVRLNVERATLDWDWAPAEAVTARLAPAMTATQAEPPSEPDTPPQLNPSSDVQALLDRLPDGIVTLDRGGHVLTFNPKAAAIFAEESSPLVGKRFSTLFGPDGTEVIDESVVQAREAGTSEPRELAGRSALPLRVRIARLFSNDEAPLYATLQDVEAPASPPDEASAIRRGIEEVAQRKLAFFARASEDVRAPLGGVLSVTQAMLDEQFGPLGNDRYREHLRDIQAFGGKALALVNDLVDFAGIESGQTTLTFSELPLNELVSSCITQLQPRATRERILVRTSFASDLGSVLADERSLRQAALNAIAHAIRLSEPGGQVIVSTMLAERGEIALRVRDTGLGMTSEEIALALEPFRADDSTATKAAQNIGLGLTLTKALVEANRGRLRIISGKDEGTLVEMLLPQREATA